MINTWSHVLPRRLGSPAASTQRVNLRVTTGFGDLPHPAQMVQRQHLRRRPQLSVSHLGCLAAPSE